MPSIFRSVSIRRNEFRRWENLKKIFFSRYAGPSEARRHVRGSGQRLRSGPGPLLAGHDAGRVLLPGVRHSAPPGRPAHLRIRLHHIKLQSGSVSTRFLFFSLEIPPPASVNTQVGAGGFLLLLLFFSGRLFLTPSVLSVSGVLCLGSKSS